MVGVVALRPLRPRRAGGTSYFDTSEVELGYDPADPNSHPGRIVSSSKNGNEVALRWESAPGVRYAVEGASDILPGSPSAAWGALAPPFLTFTNLTSWTDAPPVDVLRRYYRVRKEP